MNDRRKSFIGAIRRAVVVLFVLLLATTAAAADYVIGEGDSLSIAVWGEKDFSFTAKVRPDGKITVPAIGELTAANMTASKLQTILTEKLKTVVKRPVVTVAVIEITNNKVYVFGGGVKSGVFPLTQRVTLLQLLCQIEDVRKADLQRAYVMRGKIKIREDFTRLFIKGNTDEDIVIEANDAIYIPMANLRNIYVIGAVIAPKSIEYREGITIMEAIIEAGGFTAFAKPDVTTIYRKEKDKEVSLTIKLKQLMSQGDLSQNVALKPGDYIVVREGMF